MGIDKRRSYTTEEACRICGQPGFETVLDLGDQPLANSLLPMNSVAEAPTTYPLTFVRCMSCSSLQIRETVPREVLFSHYLYFSSYADALVANAKELSHNLSTTYSLTSADLVVDLGSNDGYLLQFYKDAGVQVLGVEPAANVAEVAESERGINTMVSFFAAEVAKSIVAKSGRAKIIHANNVLAHLSNLHSFVDGVTALLRTDGVFVCEVAYAADMIDVGAFDQIYHEHLCYYTIDSIMLLLGRHGLDVFDVEHIDNHGGSLRVYAGHQDSFHRSERLEHLLQAERARGVGDRDYCQGFRNRILSLRESLLHELERIRGEGCSIAAYGAAAKATVLMNFFEIGKSQLDFIVDRNPSKHNKVIPGTGLAVLPVDTIEREKPDYVLITAWNYAEEVMGQLTSYRDSGGRFIIPLPSLTVC
jgi:SAM-dependent methyltransferase